MLDLDKLYEMTDVSSTSDYYNGGTDLVKYHNQYVGMELTTRELIKPVTKDMPLSWIRYFMDMAKVVASKSKDTTKVGCVIASDTKQVLATGFNGFCRGVEDSKERYADRAVKLNFVVHAEANAICQSAFNGVRLRDSSAFVTLPPCHDCAKMLKQAGITTVYYLADTKPAPNQKVANDWRDKQQLSLDILHEAGIATYKCMEVNQNNEYQLKLITLQDDPPKRYSSARASNDVHLIDMSMIEFNVNSIVRRILDQLLDTTGELTEDQRRLVMDLYNDTYCCIRAANPLADCSEIIFHLTRAINNELDAHFINHCGIFLPAVPGIWYRTSVDGKDTEIHYQSEFYPLRIINGSVVAL